MRLPTELVSLLFAAVATAQTFTACDPLKSTCPADEALPSQFSTDFTKANALPAGWHRVPCAGDISYGKNGATSLAITKAGDCPTIETNAYFFFGYAEVKVTAAPGQGIVSSIVLESDVRDEVDWEFIGGENYRVQSNYFGKADTTTYDRMKYIPAANNQVTFHTLAVNWTSAEITWLVDGAAVRSLTYNDAKGGTRFPQTPMRLRIGNWAAGSPGNEKGTVDWAGGLTDFSKAPFPMSIQSAKIINYSPASSYRYKDNSGSWQSIEVTGGSTGGIVSPSQNSAAQVSVSSSTKGVSVASTMVPLQAFADGSATAAISPSPAATGSASKSVSFDTIVSNPSTAKNGTTTPTLPALISPSASTTSVKPASQTANAAVALGGIVQAAGLSVVPALLFALLC